MKEILYVVIYMSEGNDMYSSNFFDKRDDALDFIENEIYEQKSYLISGKELETECYT